MSQLSVQSLESMNVYMNVAKNTERAVDEGVAAALQLVGKCRQVDLALGKVHDLAAQVRGINAALSDLEASPFLQQGSDIPQALTRR